MGTIVSVEAAERIEGWMTRPELEWLADAASRHVSIVEIGSWKGRSTKALCGSTRGIVYAIDTWEFDGAGGGKREPGGAEEVMRQFRENVKPEINSGKCRPMRMTSSEAAWKGFIATDMVFIDGKHEYEFVKQDITAWLPHLIPSGLLCGHDYGTFDGVTMAVDELVPGKKIMENGTIWYCGKP